MNAQTRTIVAHASQLREPDRTAYLDNACGDDFTLRRTIERLLLLQESATLDGGDGARSLIPEESESEPVRASLGAGAQVGAYRLIRELGAGAMGVVYLADQDTPRRQVALKLIRSERLTSERERRFDFEADALAQLRHPCIATIFASGRAEFDGQSRAYLAMEYVEGTRLDVFARDRSLRGRIELMSKICDAIDHAHRRGIVHRDLKPSNVLVDGDGRPRVVDFGVSCANDGVGGSGEFVGTLPYMSPEQLRCEPDIDGRTDVYALGVMLHEFLTDALPRDVRGETTDELVSRASAPLDRVGGRGVPGDLWSIVVRSLAPDRSARYGSPGELGDDLRRWLGSEPVVAYSGGVSYRAAKLVQRSPGLVSLTGLAALLLIAGVIGVSWQAARATKGWNQAEDERVLADASRRRAQSINEFMVGMLTSADPESSRGVELTVREVLDASSLSLGAELRGDPYVEAGIRQALSQTYLSLGDLEAALEHASAMVSLTEGAPGEIGWLYSDALRQKSLVLIEMGNHEEAGVLLEEAKAIVDSAGDVVESARVEAEFARIMYESGRHTEALEIWESVAQTFRSELGERHKESLIMLHNRGAALKDLGQLQESEAILREVYDLRVAEFGADHPQSLVAQNVLAGVIQKQGRDDEAIAMLRDVVASRERVLGSEHFSTMMSKGNLGAALIAHGDIAEAEPLTRDTLAGFRRLFGEGHARTLTLMGNLAYLLEEQGKEAEAAALYRETIEIRRDASGGSDPETWAPMNNLAMLLQRTGDPAGARVLFEELLAMCDAMLPADHYYAAIFRNNYGACLTDMGAYSAAEEALSSSHDAMVAALGAEHPRVAKSLARMERLRELQMSGGPSGGGSSSSG